MARAADVAANRLEAGAADREFLEGKLATAQFYADQVLPQALAFEQIVKTGSDAVVSTDAAYI
jgi:butyryl-CoA dehydrogenase